MVLHVVTGVAGAGKDTTIKIAVKGIRIKSIRNGDVILELAEKEKLLKDRDEIRNMEHKKYIQLQEKAARKIAKMKGDIVLNSHCSIKTPRGYFPGLPLNILKILKPQSIIILEADPKDIMKQRKKDIGKRYRSDWGGIEEAKEHQMINRCYGATYSSLSNANLIIIKGVYNKPEKAAKELREVLI